MGEIKQVLVPDIGDFKDVPVIDVLVKPGDSVKAEDPLIVLESDKATIEVPSPFAGIVGEISVKVGDKVSEGTPILGGGGRRSNPATVLHLLRTGVRRHSQLPRQPQRLLAECLAWMKPILSRPSGRHPHCPLQRPRLPGIPTSFSPIDENAFASAHASPSVRRFARELGVNLALVNGSGPKQRILREDIQAYVKAELARPRGVGAELNLLPWPQVDFAKFGPVELKPLSRIKKISAANLHRNWVMIPHVTQFDEADMTELEALRKESNEATKKEGVKVTILAFLMRASVAALKKFPEFNASLESDGDNESGD